MKIDKNTTLKIAKLTRLKIKDSEIVEFTLQLSSILDWVEQLNEVNTNNIEPLSNVSMSKLPLREDIKSNESNIPSKMICSAALSAFSLLSSPMY